MAQAAQNKQTIEIDLTGKNGLMDTFFGDYDLGTPTPAKNVSGQPQRRYGSVLSGMMAGGIYNPFKRNGYLSPGDITLASITQGGGSTITALEAASIYDVINNDIYFAESSPNGGTRILKADGFEDSDFVVDFLNSFSGNNTDLEIYSVNGERTLFFATQYSTTTYIGTKNLAMEGAGNTFTAVAATDVITLTKTTAYTIVNDEALTFQSTGTLPAGITAGITYYVINATDSGTSATFKISGSLGGSAIDITDTGSGTHSINPYNYSQSLYFQNGFALSPDSRTKMITSGDGFMYILNVNKVHRFDGTTVGGARGTIYANILQAPTFYRFTGGLDHKSNIYLIIHQNTNVGAETTVTSAINTNCGVYIWNRQASFFNSSQFIPIYGIREIHRIWVNEKDEIMLMATDDENYGALYKYNGTSFIKIKRLPQYGTITYDDSLFVTTYGTVWFAKDGHIYCWGTAPGGSAPGLFILGDINSAPTALVILPGAVLYGATTTSYPASMYVSYTDNGTNKLGRYYLNYNGGSNGLTMDTAVGSISTPVFLLPGMSTVHHIDIFCSTTTTTGTDVIAAIKFYKNQQSTSFMTKYVTRNDTVKGYLSYEINQPYMNSLRLEIDYFNTANPPPLFN